MKTKKIPSPARSLGVARTPKRKHRRTLSVGSAKSNASGRLTAIIQQHINMDSFALSPLVSRQSLLSDRTDIEEPKRKSWWKKLNENSRDVIEFIEDNKIVEPDNIIEDLDIEVLSQEKKDYTMDLPESSDSESIHSIVIPQRKLLYQKEKQPQKKFGEIIGNRETLAKLHKTNVNTDIATANAETRELFQNKQRSKPIFPAALLNISPNQTTADKTKEFVEPKSQVRNIFGNRAATKRKNIFCNFIVSDSEDEIPDIQPKVFGFQKKLEAKRRGSSSSRGNREPSPTSSMTTDIEMDDWNMLPSSTMVENQLEIMMGVGQSPKTTRLSKLTEDKESDTGASNTTKSTASTDTSKTRKSKTFTKNKSPDLEKTRKSKTFTKEKSPKLDKSRKSKTFIKEKPDLELSMTTRNKSKISQDDEDRNQTVQNRSKNKSTDQNVSHSSIRTRSHGKGSPNSSQVYRLIEEPINVIENKLVSNISKSKSIALIANDKNKSMTDSGGITAAVDQDDEELSLSLKYDDEIDEQNIQENKSIKNKTNTAIRASTSIGQMDKTTANIRKSNRNSKVIEQSADLESTQKKTEHSMKASDKSQVKKTKEDYDKMEINEEIGTDQLDDAPNTSDMNCEDDEVGQDAVKNQNEDANQNISDEVENNKENDVQIESLVDKSLEQDENEDEIEEQNKSAGDKDEMENSAELHDEIQELEDEQNESRANDKDEQHENLEVDEDKQNVSKVENEEEQNESLDVENEEGHNESQDVDEEEQNESLEVENEEEQNESQEVENEDEQNESQEVENEDEQNESVEVENEEEQNESQEVENEEEEDEQNESEAENEDEQNYSDEEQNKSQEMSKEENQISQELEDENEEDEGQNTSQEEIEQDIDIEQNDSEEIEQEDSEAIDDSDNDNEPNSPADHDTDNQESDQELIDTETPNVSHDTTGRNRKKHETAEIILRGTIHLDSSGIKGRNTSVRKTISPNIRSTFEPREITRLSDGTKNSSAEGSGWDSHRTTRKTLRQTFGNDFTMRKSLRALVMEKSAKRHTIHEATKFQANSTELPEMTNRFDDEVEDEKQVSNHEVSLRTRQSTLDAYLQEIKEKNAEKRLQMEERVRNSLNAPKQHVFKVPARPPVRRQTKTQPKKPKSTLFLGDLPEEVIEDLKYKPPKRFQPSNAPWITKRLYKYLETKLEPHYDFKARVRAEKLVESIYHFVKDLHRLKVASTDAVDVLKREMARLDIVKTHFEFYDFFHKFMPREVRIKVIPDLVNNISLPRHGIFADIL